MKDRKTDSPRYTAQKCPVCNGFGTLSFGKKQCHACYGKGLVVIDEERGSLAKDRKTEGDEN